MLNLLYLGLGAALTFAGSLFAPEQQLGASLPQTPAGFETSLAAPITSTATSMTLTSATTRGGTALSGYNCFTIDAGSAQAEYVCGTVSGTTVSSMTRGIDDVTGTTTNATLKFSHRRGASVQITDFPAIQIIRAQLNGSDTVDNILKYTSHPTFTATTDIVDKKYVDDTAFSGAAVIDATTAARGVGELAAACEAASSTTSGGSGVLLIPASLATSTYNAATSPCKVIVANNSGQIDSGFLVNSSPVGSITAYSSTTAPTGWLLADGSAVSRTTYASLYSLLGTSYGVGDGATTFNLPNLSGRSIVMASSTQTATSTTDGTASNRATLGYKGGETMHTQTENEMRAHTHTTPTAVGTGPNQGSGAGVAVASTGASGSTGNSVAFNVLDPYIVMNYIIKY